MSINGLLNQTIGLYSKASYDEYGREVVGGILNVRARFQRQTKQRLLPNGSLILIEGIVYVPAGTTVAVDDKITFESVDYKVYGINKAINGTGGVNHIKLEVTKWKAT